MQPELSRQRCVRAYPHVPRSGQSRRPRFVCIYKAKVFLVKFVIEEAALLTKLRPGVAVIDAPCEALLLLVLGSSKPSIRPGMVL